MPYHTSHGAGDSPFKPSEVLYNTLREHPQVASWQPYIYKPSLLRTENEVQGIVLKGIGTGFNEAAFSANIIEGKIPVNTAETEEIVISQKQATLLNLAVGQQVALYFMQEPPRARKVTVVGIYSTGLEEFDENIVLCPAAMLQQLNDWDSSTVAGLEIFLHDFKKMSAVQADLLASLPVELDAQPTTQTHQATFEWLSMIGGNVEILISLIIIVACFNMVTTLLIMIMERTHMVGILKTLGASNGLISQVFIWNGLRLIGKGMLWGNAVGIGFCALQYQFHLLPLDPENYYISYVPISWDWWGIILVNIISVAFTALALLLPSQASSRMQPVKAIKFQ